MKNSGLQKTRSASLPGVIDPTYESTPNVIAELIVTFAKYRLILKLSFPRPSSDKRPNLTLFTAASWNAL